MVGEWIPFGSNQIVALNERLGALDRCQGGLFTAMVDTNPTKTKFEVPPGLTQVTILDYDFVHFINFEAEINYPEEDGIVQVENFGIHLNVDGTVLYGIKVEAIMERTSEYVRCVWWWGWGGRKGASAGVYLCASVSAHDKRTSSLINPYLISPPLLLPLRSISLDHLSRLLVDVHQGKLTSACGHTIIHVVDKVGNTHAPHHNTLASR